MLVPQRLQALWNGELGVSKVLGDLAEGAHQSLSRGPRLMKGTAQRDVVHLRKPSLHVKDWPGIAGAVPWEHCWEGQCDIQLGSFVTSAYGNCSERRHTQNNSDWQATAVNRFSCALSLC